MVQRFAKVNWSQDGKNLTTLIELVLQRLSDPNLPVQIEASKALRFLIEIEGAEKNLLPVLPHLLNEYFRIMTEIGNDEVVAALQVIIDKFGDHIEPHAVAMVVQLSSAFSAYCSAGEDDDDAAMAAAQCLECIATVLKGTCERPDLYKNMEPSLIPLVLQILGNNGDFIEYLEYALDIITFLTYFPDEIPAGLWEAFPLIYKAFDEWAFDYLNMMIAPLENFIGKSPEHFLTAATPEGIKYIDLVFSIVAKTVAEERSSESECRKALSLYMTILQYCKGHIDAYVPLINDITLAKLGQQLNADTPLTRISVMQVIASALLYNPQLQIQELEKRSVTAQVFTQWIMDSKKMDKWLPRKLTVLGLSSVLHLPTSSLPPSLTALLPQLIAVSVEMASQLHADSEKVDEPNEDNIEEVEDASLEDDDDEGGFDEDQDVTSVTDDAYLDSLNQLTGAGDMAKFLIGDNWDDDDDDDDYASPIDNVDQLLFLNDTLQAAFQREPEVYQQIQAALSPEIVTACQSLFQLAEAQRSQQALQQQAS